MLSLKLITTILAFLHTIPYIYMNTVYYFSKKLYAQQFKCDLTTLYASSIRMLPQKYDYSRNVFSVHKSFLKD